MTAGGAVHASVQVLGVLADAAWRAGILAGAAGVVLAVLPVRRAATRLAVWTMVLAAAWLIPAIGEVAPALRVPVPAAMASLPLAPARSIRPRPVPPPVVAPAPARATAAAAVPAGGPALPAASDPAPRPSPASRLLVATLLLYAAGLAVLLAGLIVGWATSARLARRATPIADESVLDRLRRAARTFGRTRTVGLVESPAVVVPIVTGVVHPRIVLPAGWRDWSTSTLDAVLAHELAHINRHDALVQRLALGYRAVFWLSPVGWWLHRHLVVLADQASDDAVLERGVDRAAYAEMLIDFLRAVGRRASRADWQVAMASRRAAERRIERILSWQGSLGASRGLVVGLLLTAVPAVLLAASVRPVWRDADRGSSPLVVAHPGPLSPPGAPAAVVEPTLAALSLATVAGPGQPVRLVPARSGADAASTTPAIQPQVRDRFSLIRDPIHGERLIALVFDVRRVPVGDLANMTATARAFLDGGLMASDLTAVSVFGSRLDVLQDFTADRARLRAAIDAVAGRPAGGADDQSRSAAVRQVCGGLERLQQDSFARFEVGLVGVPEVVEQTAVLYFDAGVRRGLEAPVEVRTLADACTRADVIFYLVDGGERVTPFAARNAGAARLAEELDAVRGIGVNPGGVTRPARVPSIVSQLDRSLVAATSRPQERTGPAAGVAVGVVAHQPGSPVTLSGTRSMLDNGFAWVRVRNDSNKPMRSITLGAVVWPNGSATRVVHVGQRGPATALAPGASLEIASEVMPGAAFLPLEAQGAVAKVGVVRVEFADGSVWTYDVVARGDFEAGGGQ
jgi:beta-lactamase regulating signal transducer with metallopeptidase domain